MTLVSAIIKDAYRETNLIPMGVDPNANQTTEALNRLNPLILASVGFTAGDELLDLNYGGDHDQSSVINKWIPDNTRLVLNLSTAVTLDTDPEPYEGQRLAVVDVAGNLAAYNLTLDGNGRNIEGASTLTLSTNSENRQWLYRGDTGNWVKITSLAAVDEMPFPTEFDDFFVLMLTLRLNPRYGQALSPESINTLKDARTRLRNRYRRKTFDIQTDPGLVKRGYLYDGNLYGDEVFNTGRFWPWLR